MTNPTIRQINPIVLPDMKGLEYGFQEWTRNLRNLLIGSYQSKDVAGNTDVTLSKDEAQTTILELYGVLTGDINVIVPTMYWQWTIHNGTTGAHNLTVKTDSGTGIVIGSGKRAILYCDNTNVVRATADV